MISSFNFRGIALEVGFGRDRRGPKVPIRVTSWGTMERRRRSRGADTSSEDLPLRVSPDQVPYEQQFSLPNPSITTTSSRRRPHHHHRRRRRYLYAGCFAEAIFLPLWPSSQSGGLYWNHTVIGIGIGGIERLPRRVARDGASLLWWGVRSLPSSNARTRRTPMQAEVTPSGNFEERSLRRPPRFIHYKEEVIETS